MEPSALSADRELVDRCLRGEPAGLSAFVARFQRLVFSVTWRLLNQREDAEDASQDVFVRAIRNLHQWDQTRPLNPWLITIAVNCCRTRLAKRKRQPQVVESVEWLGEFPTTTESAGEVSEELQKALSTLRDEYRECFVLFHQQELSIQEVAEIMNCPTGTVKIWLFRARKQLATELERRGVSG